MADFPDDLDRLQIIAANLRAQLARIEARIRRLQDAQWRDFQRERAAALAAASGEQAREGSCPPSG